MKEVRYQSTPCPECGTTFVGVRTTKWCKRLRVRYHVSCNPYCGERFKSREQVVFSWTTTTTT